MFRRLHLHREKREHFHVCYLDLTFVILPEFTESPPDITADPSEGGNHAEGMQYPVGQDEALGKPSFSS